MELLYACTSQWPETVQKLTPAELPDIMEKVDLYCYEFGGEWPDRSAGYHSLIQAPAGTGKSFRYCGFPGWC